MQALQHAHFVARQEFSVKLIHAHLGGNCRGDLLVIAGEHDHVLDAKSVQFGDHIGGFGTQRIGNRQQAQPLLTLWAVRGDHRLPLRLQRCHLFLQIRGDGHVALGKHPLIAHPQRFVFHFALHTLPNHSAEIRRWGNFQPVLFRGVHQSARNRMLRAGFQRADKA